WMRVLSPARFRPDGGLSGSWRPGVCGCGKPTGPAAKSSSRIIRGRRRTRPKREPGRRSMPGRRGSLPGSGAAGNGSGTS
ncbi:MAG: hypothetical protein AVDCRST_MAG31-1238, partial [uncultured Sphingomonas sp.]